LTCPTCGGELTIGGELCPVCGAMVAPRVEGALAPAPRAVTPPPRDRAEPLRDVPALRKREHTWRDEVQERVRSRREKRSGSGLPLFDQPEVGAQAEEPPDTMEANPTPSAPPLAASVPLAGERLVAVPHGADLAPTELGESELADLPLRAEPRAEPGVQVLAHEHEKARARVRGTQSPAPLEEQAVLPEAEEGLPVELAPHLEEQPPVERAALAGERAQAAAVDAGLLASLFVLVVYFAGRAARTSPLALAPSWPWILGYLGLLGLFYATYFTGTTGQTPGKILTGLRVVDAAGRPPSYLRAMVRAVAGALGLAVAGLGLVPMAFDPARRAMHDRLLHTRVVRR
jgi:uncharacterized RDD family membrane protein YckC